MKEVSLEDALRAIGSDLQRNRVAGLEDLKHIFLRNRQTPKLNNLTDKEYHKIFETLFRFISTEKSSYKRTSKTPVSKSTSGTRLTSCVSALRATVELGVHKIRSKTVAALLDHVTDAIQTLGDALWELLSGDYIKIMKTILQYPPHLEHLSKGDWHHVVNFCLQATGVIEPNQETQLSIRSRTRLPSESLGDRGSRASSTEPDTLRRNKSSGFENSTKTEELETCMQLLCSYPSAPIIDDAEKLLNGLVDYLQSQSSISKTPHAAFSAFNSVLAKLITYDIILVRDALLDVIPIIKRFWRTKSAILKDEMLITLMIGRPIFVQSSLSSPPDSFAERLQDLTEQLYQEYTRQPEKDFMQVDDLVFTFDQTPRPMGIRTMAPRLGVPRSEQTWITLQAIAVFSTLLDNMYLSLDEGPQTTGRPNKKQHLLSRRSDIVREASTSAGVTRICALQLLPFIFSEREPVVEELLTTIAQLTVNILDENSSTASWTMVALASMASFVAATSQELRPLWVQVWELTCRALGSPTTSRTACNLLTAILHFELLDYSIVGDTIESMISSVDLNGPSGLTDSALCMWAKLVDFRTKFNPAQNQDMSKQICTWIRNSWTLTDRVYTMQVATFARPLDLLNILMKCTGRSFDPPYPVLPGPLCRISRCFIRLRQDCKLIDYLFLTARQGPANETAADTRITYISSSVKQHPDDQLILELLQSKIDNFCQIWSQLNDDNHQHVTIEIIQILVSLCITSTVFTQSLPLPVSLRCQYLLKSTEKLWVALCGFFSRNEVEFLDSCLDVLSPIILRLKLSFDINDPVMKAVQLIAPDFIAVLDHHNGAELDSSNSAADQMDLDNHFSSQDSHIRDNDFAPKFYREDIPAYGDQNAVRRATATHLHILYYLNGANKSSEAPRNGTIVAHVTSLDIADILAARTNLVALLGSWPSISRSDACSLLVFFGETILQSYEFKMCEAALSICIELTTAFIDLWTTDEDDELFESAVDLYNWYALLVEESLGSPRVLIRIATLMGRILRADPLYPRDSSRPSPRTILFKILHDGDLTVKFHLSGIIPSVFDVFILKEHDAIFDDILENLPRDPDRNEGIALRLYLLAQLASRWHTLLRRGIYHIFEAPGQLPKSAPYAKACLQEVARSLNLDDAKEIFRLFASQMIYTWLETESLGSIPFTIFGYQALNDLLIDVEDEVVAQIVMRGKDQEMTEISNCLGMTFRGLLEHCFYKAEAYCIARDISIPPSQDSQPKGTQGRIKKILGAEQFGSLLERYFPETIAVFFKCVDQTEQMERGFEKRPAFKYALDIWKDIAKRSSSTAVLPASQQPSFRARYLLDEFDFLCTRTGYDLETMWTPSLVCFVARTLIESIHPSLGSLHACAVIRKLKILACVAGSVVLDGYPLEMLLHFLRSFLSDFHCSEDAVGLFWYLIDKGRPYLLENPYFMAGLGVSTLASLRGLLSSSQESTTQETHFRSSISKAQIFHDWFAKFLDEYESPKLSKESGKSFRTIVQSAQRINLVGSASKGTYEGELLVGLLQDSARGERLLSAPATDLVFSLICNDFQRPKDFRDDILGEDKVAAANAVTVWNTIQHRDHSSGYRLWAARVLGRAYASTGVVNDSMLKETQSSPPDDIPERARLTSKISIIRILYNSLFSNSRRDIGLAERALQQIFTSLHSEPDLGECASAIPSSLVKALTWTPYLCPDLSLTALQRAQFDHDVRWIADAPVEEWARDFTLCLSVREATNSVVGTLPKVLFEIPALAMKLLPYILHDRLLSEYEGKRIVRQAVSDVFRQAFRDVRQTTFPHIRLIIHCILHLRHQKIPHEQTMNQRDAWLDIDYLQAAHAAAQCKMYKTSLLFVEIHFSRTSSTRRLAVSKLPDSLLLLHDIFKNIEDPDLFYGIQQSATLDSVLEKLQHESAGFGLKNLSFQSANYEAEMKLSGTIGETSTLGLIRALNTTNFQGVASAMFTAPTSNGKGTEVFENMLSTSLHLQQWDIPVPSSSPSAAGNVFKVLQSLNSSDDKLQVARILDNSFSEVLRNLEKNQSHVELRDMMRAIGILAEIDQVMCSQNLDQLQDAWERIQAKGSWLKFERFVRSLSYVAYTMNGSTHLIYIISFRDVSLILSSHEALFSLINRQPHIKSMLSVSSHDAQLLEVKTIRESLKISREHDEHQASLKSAISLSKLIKPCAELGVFIDAAATFDLANVLWDQGEMTISIQMLQQLSEQNDLQNQSIALSILTVNVSKLKGKSEGEEAGRVFHEFAVFCDQQLQNPDSLEDFRRIEQIRHRKEREVLDLEQMIESARNKERESLLMHISRAKQWFELDDKEYQRLKESRVSFLRQCLEKYLLSLKASDKFKNNVLRFCALWLDNSESEAANGAVAKYINAVPSRMFAPLMNQLSSRLLDVEDSFQPLLANLIFRICREHPYHGMYQIFNSSRSTRGRDHMGTSRYRAANSLVDRLKVDPKACATWLTLHNTNVIYVRFATDRLDNGLKSGSKVALRKTVAGQRLEQDIRRQRIPPPTMKIDLRIDCDYSQIPRIVRYLPEFTVASGVSAPKIVSAIASDGLLYRQLRFKEPDDWFSKRLAYTRSTAAISMLGHVLGLGDRHGHNILLDEKTGEVVHIDLGVAFEQGRVLPIPEVVPFRLTRDLVDGMGVTKTEGVFRRCCEFTLEALRRESYSIMTILDVLRYDPLYSWSLSPLRIKKMQDTQEAAEGAAHVNESGKSKNPNEPSEADRALTVVAKKLGKTLSVAATVNELIQQATDERNLALLYCGWAAYA
ncbi:phosphatidylinositol 3- and 4-kinase [Histoplasma capsulatum H143]|uniref:Serine/threonine-protein kinase Tel1 n=1 Tax=Ajellomyces capsulatus (strain H143) TaxID=544712 RepID=C6HKP4_AJECH|nr:phosphatidylinositol 3- and 4-kinase [Histoplasma capsulatum H143]